MSYNFKKLTAANIKALLPGKRLEEGGVCAERTKAGDVRWSVNVMVDGARIHRVIGRSSDGVTRTQAVDAIASLRTRARESRLSLPAGRKTYRSFKEASEEYLRRMDGAGGKNMPAKRRHLRLMLIPHFGQQRVNQITTLMVQEYVVKRRRDVVQATVNRELATLSHAMKRWVEWGWIKSEEAPRIYKAPEARKPISVLSDEDMKRLMKAALLDADRRIWLFIAFGLNTAMRHSEILRTRYSQVDVTNRRIFVPQAKAGEREQPITASLASLIEEQLAKDGKGADWIFPAVRKKTASPHRVSLAKAFRRTVERAGLSPEKITPHVMRHTAITRLVRSGIDLPTVQRISAHKTMAMVLRYVHLHGPHIDAAIKTIDFAPTSELH